MVVDVPLFRFPGQPFGFRLIGGRDFEIPLTVSRVVESSIAQASGLREGDVVVRINDDPTIEMTHEDAHMKLAASGNEFVLGVLRATNLLAESEFASVESHEELEIQQEQIDKIIPDKAVTDEEIAELLSGEAEVLKGHGVLGVNFNRMMPKSGVFKRSEVFQVLNDEQLKTQAESDRENQRWTTFLQKPNRPVPSASNSLITSTYKPVIVKQPKPKCAPDYRVTPSPSPQPVEVCKEETVQQEDETECQEVENCLSEWIATTCSEEIDIATEFSMETFVTTTTTTTTAVTFEEIAAEATGECANEELLAEEIKSQSDEVSIVSSAFAEQLVNVQNQLMALSHLPRTIQSTLDEITKQLQSLIPTPKSLQKSVEPEICKASDGEKAVTNEEATETPIETAEQQQQQNNSEEQKCEATTMMNQETTTSQATVEVIEHHPTNDEIEEYEESQRKFRELWEKKREKQEPVDPKNELSAELKQKVTEDRTVKQKKARNFRGLQAAERPIILPGGRKWKNAKDAMNDELIAEIISSQAELIMGTTLGHNKYESPVLHFDDRVNFLKYQKPEKDLSFLKNSETYRTIHHMGQQDHGIAKRPAVVASEEDILKCASPHPLNQNSS